jgi:hypothetical protein
MSIHKYTVRNWATSLEVAGSILDGVTEIFHGQPFRLRCASEVDSTSNRNEYQEHLFGGKGGRCVGLTTLPPSCADCLDIRGASNREDLRAPIVMALPFTYIDIYTHTHIYVYNSHSLLFRLFKIFTIRYNLHCKYFQIIWIRSNIEYLPLHVTIQTLPTM